MLEWNELAEIKENHLLSMKHCYKIRNNVSLI